MMTVLYILIGVAVGAVVLYVVMNQRVGRLHVALAKKETEMALLTRQREEERQHNAERQAEQLRSQREMFDQQLKTTKEQLANMTRQLLDSQATKLKEENKESMGSITQPLKEAIAEMRKAITDNTKDHTAQTASLKEQLRLMMETGREMSEKAEGLANVLRRDNKVSGNMGEIILGDLLASQGLT